MASLGSLISKARTKYDKWEAGSKERERKRVDGIQAKRARAAVKHLYQMERAKRKTEIAQYVAAAKEAEVRARRSKSELRGLRIKDIKGYASLVGLGTGGKRTKSKKRRRRRD